MGNIQHNENTTEYPAYLYYPVSMNPSANKVKSRDYVLMGLAFCLPAFLGTALLMTILSVTLLHYWIPDVILAVMGAALSFVSLFGTLHHFLSLDKKQYKL